MAGRSILGTPWENIFFGLKARPVGKLFCIALRIKEEGL
jgi:hypothetical protein